MSESSLGEIGYQAFSDHIHSETGQPLPDWNAATPIVRDGWDEAGDAVRAYLTQDMVESDELKSLRVKLAEARTAAGRLQSRIVASAHLLDKPFTNAMEMSPWALMKLDLERLRKALNGDGR